MNSWVDCLSAAQLRAKYCRLARNCAFIIWTLVIEYAGSRIIMFYFRINILRVAEKSPAVIV